MVSSKVLNLILALQVLTMLIMYVNALPITSKPIENTAENLAWQAWLMLPPEQKNLEKSRKVTPKSIFTLPFRDCPPGHHLFENRCIPTVQIDQTALLTQELLGFVDGLAGGNTDNNYGDFGDYDDLGGEIVAEVMYDPAQKLNGNDDASYNDTAYDQLPSQDEPLKFNIFQQKFPTDYEGMATPNEEAEQQQQQQSIAKSNNSTNTTLAEAVNALALGSSMPNASDTNVDLQMESSNVSTNIAQKTNDIVTPTTTFAISDIDAIALPAVTTTKITTQLGSNDGNGADANGDYLETSKQNIHKFSLFKDDSSVQLVTSSLLADHNNENSKQQPDLRQLLKADDLLPLPNIAAAATTTTTKTQTDNEVPTLLTAFMASNSKSNAESTTTLLSSKASNGADNDEVTDMMLSDVDATLPTIRKEIDYVKKAEHPRSVIDGLEAEAQESSFATTTEAVGTTNFQLDETTIVEVHDAPTIALKELLELAEPQHPSDGLGVVKKSKVEPVELPPIIETATADPTLSPTEIITTETSKTSASTAQPTIIKLMTPTATPSLPLAATSTKTTDRFDNYKQKVSTKTGDGDNNDKEEDDNDDTDDDKLNFRNAETSTIPTTTPETTAKTSEIDSEQELRMINELVKGNKNNNNDKDINEKSNNAKHQHQLNAKKIKSTTVEAESGLTTTTVSALEDTSEESSSIITMPTTSTSTSISSKSAIITTTTTEPSTTTIWSKIMPLLGFNADINSSSSSSSTLSTDETTNSASIATTTAKSVSSFSPASTKSNLNINFSNNRSNRNSKIIRINSLSSFSPSTNSKAHIITSSGSSFNKQTADKLALSSPQSSQMVTTTKTTSTTTTETPTSQIPTTTTEIAEISVDSSSISSISSSSSSSTNSNLVSDDTSTTTDSDSDQGEPFWWLPIGWRLDRANEPSLLLRFWSALPGQGE